MKNKLLKLIVLGMVVMGGVCGLLPQATYAADPFCDNLSDATEEVRRAAGCNGQSEDTTRIVIENIIRTVIACAGFVAVIFIIIGGVNYMTSAGDAAKLKKAKDTILYAVIGLVICALAFAIVNWTIGIINANNSSALIMDNYLAFLIKLL